MTLNIRLLFTLILGSLLTQEEVIFTVHDLKIKRNGKDLCLPGGKMNTYYVTATEMKNKCKF